MGEPNSIASPAQELRAAPMQLFSQSLRGFIRTSRMRITATFRRSESSALSLIGKRDAAFPVCLFYQGTSIDRRRDHTPDLRCRPENLRNTVLAANDAFRPRHYPRIGERPISAEIIRISRAGRARSQVGRKLTWPESKFNRRPPSSAGPVPQSVSGVVRSGTGMSNVSAHP